MTCITILLLPLKNVFNRFESEAMCYINVQTLMIIMRVNTNASDLDLISSWIDIQNIVFCSFLFLMEAMHMWMDKRITGLIIDQLIYLLIHCLLVCLSVCIILGHSKPARFSESYRFSRWFNLFSRQEPISINAQDTKTLLSLCPIISTEFVQYRHTSENAGTWRLNSRRNAWPLKRRFVLSKRVLAN